jgi:hypothetical protein
MISESGREGLNILIEVDESMSQWSDMHFEANPRVP